MQRVSGMTNPLLETSVVRRGSRLAFRHAGALVDPITRQLAFDFDLTHKSRQLRVLRTDESSTAIASELQEIFHRAVRLEEDQLKRDEAIALYHQVLARDPNHAPACINLGTIHYTQRDFVTAEAMYRRATIADPEYALAFFDLGNVLDELQHLPEAIEAYGRAVALVPAYADAHYNLALAYERKGERRRRAFATGRFTHASTPSARGPATPGSKPQDPLYRAPHPCHAGRLADYTKRQDDCTA